MARKISYGKPCYQTYQNTQNSLKSGLAFDANFEHPTFQGVTNERALTQGVASLALGYVHHWAFIDIIGCGSAIQASLIAFALHDDSARHC